MEKSWCWLRYATEFCFQTMLECRMVAKQNEKLYGFCMDPLATRLQVSFFVPQRRNPDSTLILHSSVLCTRSYIPHLFLWPEYRLKSCPVSINTAASDVVPKAQRILNAKKWWSEFTCFFVDTGETQSPMNCTTLARHNLRPAVGNIFAAFWHARCFIKLSQSSPPAIWQLRGTLFHSIHLSMVKTA